MLKLRTELDDNIAEVIGMPRPSKEALVTNRRLITLGAEDVLLHITDTLHDEANNEQNHTDNISASTESDEGVLRDIGRVDESNGQRDGPDPDHLEHPEAQEGEELIALVIEAVVFSCLEDAEQEEAREP